MNLRDLQYLVAVAKYRHFGKAAEACFVSQPTLSTQIKKLEDELGVTLIERNNKQMMLTEIGVAIVAKAQHMLQTGNEIKNLAEHYRDPEAGSLSLGVIPTLAPYLLPHIMPAIKKRFPKLKTLLYEEQTAVLLGKLLGGRLDAALLALPVEESALKSLTLFAEPFYAALPAQHPLTKKSTLTLEDVAKADILLLEDGHCLRDQTLDLCRKVGATEVEGFRGTSLETLRHMVASGAGITFMPALAVNAYKQAGSKIKILPFKPPQPSRQIGLVYRATSHRESMLKELATVIKTATEQVLAKSA
ncbi:MAG TPA: DNA-binding transcriptional regulator OxyR [Gammaproteobacteria bacterium]